MARSPENRSRARVARSERDKARRARQIVAIKREQAIPAGEALRTQRALAVVALAGSSTESFKTGLDAYLGEGRVLWLPAFRNVQGHDHGDHYGRLILEEIIKHRRKHAGYGVVAFTDYRFKEKKERKDGTPITQGTKDVREKIEKMMTRPEETKTATTPQLRLSAKTTWLKRESAVLFIGEGDSSDLPASPAHDALQEHSFGTRDLAYLVLNTDGELRSMIDVLSSEAAAQSSPMPAISPGGVHLPFLREA